MAIIYSYPTVIPTESDLVLGTDVDAAGQPTKNFTVKSIIDLVTVSGNDLQAVLTNGNVATSLDINLTNNFFRGGGLITTSNATVSGTTATGFTNITSTDFTGNLTGIIKSGSSIQSTVTAVTQNQGDNSTKIATTAYVDSRVDTSVLQYLGDSTGPFTLNLINDDFKIAGTTNQIETTATTVAGNVGTITLKFPTAGVVLPNGSTATTQAASDDSNKVATTAFVRDYDDLQDLDFTTGSGSGSVLLNSQSLTLAGTSNQITTSGSGQTATFALTSSVTISGTYTGTTFAGDLLGTINTATTGVTQSAGNNSTKIATTAYVDNAAGSKTLEYTDSTNTVRVLNLSTDDLKFLGDSNITVTAAAVAGNVGTVTVDLNNSVNISGTMTAGTFTDGTFTGSNGTYTGYASITSTSFVGALTGNASTATQLASSGAIAITGDTTSTGGPYTYTSGGAINISTTIADTTVTAKVLTNLPTPTSSTIAASDTILAAMAKLQGQITGIPQGLVYKGTWNAATNTPTLASGTGTTGEFYIVSVAGSTNLDGITDWQVGDWAIFVEVGATDTWQKIDNSQSITGSGATNKITKWTAPSVLGTGLIEDDGTDVTIGNNGNLIVEGNTTLGNADSDTTTIKGPARFEETLRADVGISLGNNNYGSTGQVLTSGGGSASVNTWTTPTTGTVTSVATNNGLTGGTITTTGTLGILTVGTSNAIEFLTAATPANNDLVWFSDINDSNTLRKCTVADLQGPIGGPFLPLAGGTMTGNTLHGDNVKSRYGTGNDLEIYHDSSNSYIATTSTSVGDLRISQEKAGSSIVFFADLGGASADEYFRVDGSNQEVRFSANTRHLDNVVGFFGSSDDLRIVHNTTNSLITNKTGNIIITTEEDDSDIVFKSDDGSGGVVEYFRLDGSSVFNVFSKQVYLPDNVKATFGDGSDLQIYHDASNSYILNSTGSLIIGQAAGAIALRPVTNENGILIVENGAVTLYYDNSAKLATTAGGISVTGDADVSGEVQVGGQGSNFSENNLRFKSAGAAYIDHNTVGQSFIFRVSGSSSLDTQVLVLNSSGSAELPEYGSGSITGTATYNLEVDSNGKIIETPSSGGGGGIFHGDQAITTGNAALTFTLKRATTGTLIFDVWFTSETSTATSVAKKYVVAHSSDTAPVYNKILDTGPDGSNDFTVTFANATTTATGDSVTCSIQASGINQNIGYTVQVGYDSANALTFTAAS